MNSARLFDNLSTLVPRVGDERYGKDFVGYSIFRAEPSRIVVSWKDGIIPTRRHFVSVTPRTLEASYFDTTMSPPKNSESLDETLISTLVLITV